MTSLTLLETAITQNSAAIDRGIALNMGPEYWRVLGEMIEEQLRIVRSLNSREA